jgi:hypothetical protein
MPKYVPRLEGIMHSPSDRALCLLTLGHISAYNMDNTILLYKYMIMTLITAFLFVAEIVTLISYIVFNNKV